MANDAAFKKGDRVAWSHVFATQHASGSVMRASAVLKQVDDKGKHAEPGTGQFGTVQGPGNEARTHWLVLLDDGETWTLTSDELVKIDESEE